MNKGMATSKRCAERLSDGSIRRLTEPSYHGNPIDEGGSLGHLSLGLRSS